MHDELAQRLRDLVVTMRPDTQMPTEKELVQSFAVSRTTVRRALSALVEERLLVRRQGAGTFVAPRRTVHLFDQLRPFVSIFDDTGSYPQGRIVRFELIDPSGDPDEVGGKGHGGLLVRRLYTVGEAPHGLVDITLPPHIGRRIARAQIDEHPVYEVLQDDLGIEVDRGDLAVSSVGASAEDATALRVEVGSPLLGLARVTYDRTGAVVERTEYRLLPHLFEMRLTVTAQGHRFPSYSFSRPGPAGDPRVDRAG